MEIQVSRVCPEAIFNVLSRLPFLGGMHLHLFLQSNSLVMFLTEVQAISHCVFVIVPNPRHSLKNMKNQTDKLTMLRNLYLINCAYILKHFRHYDMLPVSNAKCRLLFGPFWNLTNMV